MKHITTLAIVLLLALVSPVQADSKPKPRIDFWGSLPSEIVQAPAEGGFETYIKDGKYCKRGLFRQENGQRKKSERCYPLHGGRQ